MQIRELSIEGLHSLTMRCRIVAFLAVSRLLMLALLHTLCRCGPNPDHVGNASDECDTQRYQNVESINGVEYAVNARWNGADGSALARICESESKR